ncbi:MAG: pilus (MSHA type) biogenesis protein MshL [Desulfobulbaceae bacterium]|nr:pilus (MSHA type) biogenesis protein MshL [Desulfobulbaceae bacterium]
MADLKRMNVSWASDVNQNALVDVHINANDDFYDAISDLLRQLDYYYEVKGNTIVVKYKETRSFQIAMPFIKTQYTTGVGGNMLGGGDTSTDLNGTIQLKSTDNPFDVWENIETNLKALLGIWALDAENKAKTASESSMDNAAIIEKCQRDNPNDPAMQETCVKTQKESRDNMAKLLGDEDKNQAAKKNDKKSGSGQSENGNYYIIDKPVGIITVSAPRPLLEKIDEYFNNLKKSLYRQVSIEAKIIEVQLNDSSSIGINWNAVLSNFSALNGTVNFGADGQVYPYVSAVGRGRVYGYTDGSNVLHPLKTDADGNDTNVVDTTMNRAILASTALQDPGRFISSVVLQSVPFTAMINALKTEGQTKVLSSPKLSVMNGQPAMISVGRNYTYIDSIDVDVDDETGDKTYTVETERLLSGLGMSLTATILGDDEIILNLVPVTSELVPSASSATSPDEPIYSKSIGADGASVGLPVMNVREMSTTVKIRDGEMLAIGGLISETDGKEGNFAPILGSIPIIRYLFGYETKQKKKNELIILLKPKII